MAKSKNIGNACGVSVIVALYNAENYIGECLESLLAQTFKDFEVIVVDDCSTDNSAGVVESFAPRFEGRLKFFKSKKNSGFPGVPRNTALKFARGKYVTFLDCDDFFTPKAIEEIFAIAEETGAEVVHAGEHYRFTDGKNDSAVFHWERNFSVDAPTPEPENLAARLTRLVNFKTLWWACNKFYRRDFLEKNNIAFPNATTWEDFTFFFCSLIRAKNYIRVPNIFYNYRVREGSLSHKARGAVEITRNLAETFRVMDKFMQSDDYFARNPNVRWVFLDWYAQNRLRNVCRGLYEVSKLESYKVDRIFTKVFAELKEIYPPLVSYFFTLMTQLKFKTLPADAKSQ